MTEGIEPESETPMTGPPETIEARLKRTSEDFIAAINVATFGINDPQIQMLVGQLKAVMGVLPVVLSSAGQLAPADTSTVKIE